MTRDEARICVAKAVHPVIDMLYQSPAHEYAALLIPSLEALGVIGEGTRHPLKDTTAEVSAQDRQLIGDVLVRLIYDDERPSFFTISHLEAASLVRALHAAGYSGLSK